MDSLLSCVGRSWCISWMLQVKLLLWGSNQHDNPYFHLNHYPWSWDLRSKLHFWIINSKQVHPEPWEPHFRLTWDHQLRSLTTKDWSNISTTSIYYTTDGLKYGCQQQPICEPKPHHCRFLYCPTFWSVQSNISSWYIMLNEFQSYKNFSSQFWQQWILMMELHIFIHAYLANSIAYLLKTHTAPLSMNCPLMRMGKMKKFVTTILIELWDSLTCLMHSSIICPWWWALPPLLSYTPTLSNEVGLWQQCQCYCLVSGPKNSTPLLDIMTAFLMPVSQLLNKFMSWLLVVQRYVS